MAFWCGHLLWWEDLEYLTLLCEQPLGFRVDFLCFTCSKISNTVFCVLCVPYSDILRKFIFGGKVASECLSFVQGFETCLSSSIAIDSWLEIWVRPHISSVCACAYSLSLMSILDTLALCVCHWCHFLMPSASSLVFWADSLVEAALSCLRPGV